jgi:hypothetical protein
VTPNEIITEVRRLIQDTKVTYRYSDAIMLGWVNQTLKRTAVLRPDLFGVIGDIATTPNVVLQSTPTDSLRLIQIFQVKNGDAVTEVDREVFDQTYPGWVNEAASTPVNFMRHVRNPNKFFVYPRPTSGVILVGEYAQVPPDYALNDTIALIPEAYFPVLIDGVVFLAESVDDEHVNSQRAALFQKNYTEALGASVSNRVVTDTKQAGLDRKQVI